MHSISHVDRILVPKSVQQRERKGRGKDCLRCTELTTLLIN